jgi:2-hydroxy-3-keto-5-methylthiopentenyl-1-phosphate phosphatase
LKREPNMLFVVDFDGTIAPVDTVDALLERFADPEWQRIEEKWVRGEIDSRQCMAAQIALVRGADRLLERFLASVEIDPHFGAFVEQVNKFAQVAIISDGLDYPIAHALRKLGLSIPFFANRLSFHPRGLDLSFPYSDSACAVSSGVCKCAVARRVDSDNDLPWILIGDGRSDICIAQSADYVFAKGTLRRFCEAEGIFHTPFETFADVLSVVKEWDGQRFEQDPVRRVNVR